MGILQRRHWCDELGALPSSSDRSSSGAAGKALACPGEGWKAALKSEWSNYRHSHNVAPKSDWNARSTQNQLNNVKHIARKNPSNFPRNHQTGGEYRVVSFWSVGICLESVEVNIAFHGPMLEFTKKLEPLGITSATCRHVDTPDSMVIEEWGINKVWFCKIGHFEITSDGYKL